MTPASPGVALASRVGSGAPFPAQRRSGLRGVQVVPSGGQRVLQADQVAAGEPARLPAAYHLLLHLAEIAGVEELGEALVVLADRDEVTSGSPQTPR